MDGTLVRDCLFSENYTMYSSGGALNMLGSGNTLFLANNTIAGNSALHGDGGAMSLAYGTAYLANCIVYGNPGMYSDNIYLDFGGHAEIHYSDLPFPDGATGSHNINTNPLFQDAAQGDFQLQGTSPCVDSGTDYIMLGGRVLVNLAADQYCGQAPDMGAFESCPLSAAGDETLAVFKLNQNCPNPFARGTAISFELAVETPVLARVYNVRGQAVRTLADGLRGAGAHSLFWNGRDDCGRAASQGVYFLRLAAGDQVRNLRMVLTR